ncbi:toll/interleukin-1 receptor domain-containing protein [Frankia sp. AgB32]|uniref:toll/interleukin-1 receptor domain-containing protein n=1 Tax=Frankia sp. AgB32 TaxID=631119 RepID=UPI00200BEF3F|nr:toll/interleukin-1 receptor domain-containing protein [Frankia sp. AgB32]MCK9895397.1 toll/interleukin-1 receptor domain-containing protein [Frankia sp. AgB32]
MESRVIGFLSYAHLDDDESIGQPVTAFRKALEGAVTREMGYPAEIFQDLDLRTGQLWKQCIDETLETVAVLLPILTPSFFASDECTRETQQFMRHVSVKRGGLVIPIRWQNSGELSGPAESFRAELLTLQDADWRDLRFAPPTAERTMRALNDLARVISEALKRPRPPEPADEDHLRAVIGRTTAAVSSSDLGLAELVQELVDAVRDLAWLEEDDVRALRRLALAGLGQPPGHLPESPRPAMTPRSGAASRATPHFQQQVRTIVQTAIHAVANAGSNDQEIVACLVRAVRRAYLGRSAAPSPDSSPLGGLEHAVEHSLQSLQAARRPPERRTAPPAAADADTWVLARPVGDVAAWIGTNRAADPHGALRALLTFATSRPVADLVAAPGAFDAQDRDHILLTAALCREPAEVAELLASQWGGGSAGPDDALAHSAHGPLRDFARRRAAGDVDAFLRTCRERGLHALADDALREFAARDFARTYNIETAQLYHSLRGAGGRCADQATELLHGALARAIDREASRPLGTSPDEVRHLLRALGRLSPRERILPAWVSGLIMLETQVDDTAKVVAYLIANVDEDADALTEIVGCHLRCPYVVSICGRLATSHPARCADIRRYAAARDNAAGLLDIVAQWTTDPRLKGTVRTLIAEVAAGAGRASGPRPIDDLVALSDLLPKDARDLLWTTAGEYPEGRSAEDLGTILGRLPRPRDGHRRFARAVVASAVQSRSIDPVEVYLGQLRQLRQGGERMAAEAVGIELTDFATPPGVHAETVAAIAAPLYASPDRTLRGFGEQMLAHYLRSSQHVTAVDVRTVVEGLRDCGVDPLLRCALLTRTVRGWLGSDPRRRVAVELRAGGLDREAACVEGRPDQP